MSVFTGRVVNGAESLKSGDNTRVMRTLVVEDEERLARLISRVLTEEGYAVETEANGRQALARALAGEYDLLIVDWMLPDLSGVQLVKRLRAAEVGTPAIMLTARDQIEDRVEGLDAGADDYLPKPFAFPELLARVRALARRPRQRPGPEPRGPPLGQASRAR
jgi:DNA-binding response OmpR family regulator